MSVLLRCSCAALLLAACSQPAHTTLTAPMRVWQQAAGGLRGGATTLARQVHLGSAIVAAVEQDVEDEEAEAEEREQRERTWSLLGGDDDVSGAEIERRLLAWQHWLADIEVGRGKGHKHKQRKLLKMLYPLLVGLVVAKTVLIPLILKALTALSATAFVFSKVALAVSGLLTLRWLFAAPAGHDAKAHTHFEFVQVPVAAGKASLGSLTRHPAAGVPNDLAWSGTNSVTNQLPPLLGPKGGHKFIPAQEATQQPAVAAEADHYDHQPFL